jgi:Holliday junction resolvase
MANKQYQAGRRFEYRVRDHFRKLGFFVMRAPASKSPVDMIVIGHHVVLLVQCKVSGVISSDAWNELWVLADATCGARAILCERVKRKIVMHELVGLKKRFARERPWVQVSFGENDRCAESTRHSGKARPGIGAAPDLAA